MATKTVYIEARIESGGHGGIEQVYIGLAGGFQRQDQDLRFRFGVLDASCDWLVPYLMTGEALRWKAPPPSLAERIRAGMGRWRPVLGRIKRRLLNLATGSERSPPTVQASDGFAEASGADLVHLAYPMQIYQPATRYVLSIYDLQHRHFPEFFSVVHIEWREVVWKQSALAAAAVVTDSHFVRADVIKSYGLPEDRVFAVPLAASTEWYEECAEHELFGLLPCLAQGAAFALFPATTYRHKNHERLLHAWKRLKDAGSKLLLVCPGPRKLYWPNIERTLNELGLSDQVYFPGFVSSGVMQALYTRCKFVVFPSLFEGAGLPLLEAFHRQRAVACSRIAAFQEYGGDAVAQFDPTSVEDMVRVLSELDGNDTLRGELALAGHQRSHAFSWQRTAGLHALVYRFALGLELTDEQRRLLDACRPPLSSQ